MDTTLKRHNGKLPSLEEIAVGIAGERPAKSGALSHYEDRRERKGWLVEGVHGISIARRNNWVQSGRLPYVTSAPFKRESASASSSHPHPRPSILPILEQPRTCLRAGKKTSSTRGKKRPEEGDYRAKCTRTREGRAREGEEEEDRGRTRETWISKKRGARAHCGNRGRRSGALLVSKPAVGGPRRKKEEEAVEEEPPKNDFARWMRGDRARNKNNATGNTEQKQRKSRAQNNRPGPRRARSHNCLGAQWRGCPVNRRRTTPPPLHSDPALSFRLSRPFATLAVASFSRRGCSLE